VPKIFNINKQHFILEQFSVGFEYDINTVKKSSGTISFFPSREILRKISKEKDSLTVKMTEENISKKWPNIPPNNTSHRPLVATCYEFIISLLFKTHHHQPVFLPSSRLFYPLFYSYIYRIDKKSMTKCLKTLRKYWKGNKKENSLT
jgi:hypothetical protein